MYAFVSVYTLLILQLLFFFTGQNFKAFTTNGTFSLLNVLLSASFEVFKIIVSLLFFLVNSNNHKTKSLKGFCGFSKIWKGQDSHVCY